MEFDIVPCEFFVINKLVQINRLLIENINVLDDEVEKFTKSEIVCDQFSF